MPKHPDKPMTWNATAERALWLVFEGRWTQAQIIEKLSAGAQKFAVSTRTLQSWVAHPEFQRRLAELRADLTASLQSVTFADKARRIMALDTAAKIALGELEARPLLKEIRPTREGEIINEAYNQAAHAEFRASLADIAAELGHRKGDQAGGPTVNIAGSVVLYMPQPELPPPDGPQIVDVVPEQPPDE